MRRIKFFMLLGLLAVQQHSEAQGCVAIRSTGSSCSLQEPVADNTKWQFNANYRYFKSFRHFKGKEEQKERLEQNTEVINYSHALDLSIVRKLNSRWSLSLNMPLLSNVRSSLYEHGLVNGVYVKRERRNTESFGLGDIRASAYYWVFDPKKAHKGNIQIGMGIKFATGDYNYQDYWHNVGPNGSSELRTVDQSIQLGDGGTGFTAEVNTYRHIARNLGVYASAFYLINPREVNGTRTYRETLSPALANETICSVPDQYMMRAGFSYMTGKITVMAGGRIRWNTRIRPVWWQRRVQTTRLCHCYRARGKSDGQKNKLVSHCAGCTGPQPYTKCNR
ncbi:MAG: hypothetical protein QM781_18275 [Chitinophagaceae bacterium]